MDCGPEFCLPSSPDGDEFKGSQSLDVVLLQPNLRVAGQCGLFLGEAAQLLPDSLNERGRGVSRGRGVVRGVLWSG